jgi:hypothetical protein
MTRTPQVGELALLCHPSRKTQAEEFAAKISDKLAKHDTITILPDARCPTEKVHLINRDFYDHFDKDPLKALALIDGAKQP